MLHKKRVFLLLLCIFILLVGCSDQEIIGELSYVTALAIDKQDATNKQNDYVFTAFVTDYEQNSGQLMSIEEKNKIEAINQLDKRSERRLVTGQMRMVLFGEEISRDGMKEHLFMLDRHPDIKSRLKLVVVEGEAKQALQLLVDQNKDGDYIGKILDKYYQDRTAPEINICTFSRELLDDGREPFMPLISVEGKELHWSGTALFKQDRYVETLNRDETDLFLILSGAFQNGRSHVTVDDREIGLSDIRTKQKINVQSGESQDSLMVHINVRLQASLVNINGQKDAKEQVAELEKSIAASLVTDTKSLLEKLQKSNVDPIGVGRYVRNHVGFTEWQNTDWDDLYNELEIIPHIEVRLMNTGRLE